MFSSASPTLLQPIVHPLLTEKKVSLLLKRDDQIDTEISGNKWRKLKFNLIDARNKGFETILTFGGAYSNHIAATAAACKRFGFKSIGYIRGDELNKNSNPTLQKAARDGMELRFISRSDYKERDNLPWIKTLEQQDRAYVIPEGGSNEQALKGVSALVQEIEEPFDCLVCPVGTGGTLAGLVRGINHEQSIIGIASLKGSNYLEQLITDLLPDVDTNHWNINHDYHFGGYAKFDDHLIDFMMSFSKRTGIPLDPVYTGKMMYGIFDLIRNDFFAEGTRIIALHTGGIQGVFGFNEKNKRNLLAADL